MNHFQQRIAEGELDFCLELFEYATVRLLAHKYSYYICSKSHTPDHIYDLLERDWALMGNALGVLEQGQNSPCVDFDFNHPLAEAAIELAKTWSRK